MKCNQLILMILSAFFLIIPYGQVTAIAASLSGTVFHDYNGNGLLDPGEPGIAGAEVSIGSRTFTSDENGLYWIGGLSNRTYDVSIKSPTDDPTIAFRYMSVFKGWVDIPAYEMNGVQVPDQRLADAQVQSINELISIEITGDAENDLALIQGFLTLPFFREQVPEPFEQNYFDILNNQIICDERLPRDGESLNYNGRFNSIGDPFLSEQGVGDAHNGIDYSVQIGNYVVHAGPISEVWLLPIQSGELRVHTMFQDPDNPSMMFKNAYGHLGTQLVSLNETVYRGQIIGISGDSGDNNSFPGYYPQKVPQLHFDLSRTTPDKCTQYLDPYRATISGQSPENYSGSDVSYWTKDNDPQHPF